MKTLNKTLCVLALSGLLAACGGPTIDGKNSTTMQQSIEAIMAKLEPAEQRAFAQNLAIVGTSISLQNGISLEGLSQAEDRMLKALDGKTPSDVAKMAEEFRAKNR